VIRVTAVSILLVNGVSARLVIAAMRLGRFGDNRQDARTGHDSEPALCRKHEACGDCETEQKRQENEQGARCPRSLCKDAVCSHPVSLSF
jgi:hypothetical protein